MTAPASWTQADRAELAVAVAELILQRAQHERRCHTCRALAQPCAVRTAIAGDPYDRTPLAAPAGFYGEQRRRLVEHEQRCRTCRAGRPGRCAAVGAAIQVVLDWRWRRGLLSRAEWLRRRHLRDRLAELRREAA